MARAISTALVSSALIQSNLGLDETVHQTSSSKQRQPKLNNALQPAKNKKNSPPSATLIVAPTSLIDQWAEEIERSSKPKTVKVVVWHGQNRGDLDVVLEEDDEPGFTIPIKIVITSYGTLVSEHAKAEKSSSPVYDGTLFLSVQYISRAQRRSYSGMAPGSAG